MNKRYWGAIIGLVGLGIITGGAHTVSAASGPGTSLSDSLTSEGVTFAVGADGQAAGRSMAQFQITPGNLSLAAVPNLSFKDENVTDLIKGDLTLTTDSATSAVTNDATGWDGNNAKTIRVTDYRGNNAGWQLRASLGTFANTTQTDKTLAAISATLAGGNLTGDNVSGLALTSDNFSGAGAALLSADQDQGSGESVATFTSATIILPRDTTAVAGAYKAAIDWTLEAGPDAVSPGA